MLGDSLSETETSAQAAPSVAGEPEVATNVHGVDCGSSVAVTRIGGVDGGWLAFAAPLLLLCLRPVSGSVKWCCNKHSELCFRTTQRENVSQERCVAQRPSLTAGGTQRERWRVF